MIQKQIKFALKNGGVQIREWLALMEDGWVFGTLLRYFFLHSQVQIQVQIQIQDQIQIPKVQFVYQFLQFLCLNHLVPIILQEFGNMLIVPNVANSREL